MKFKRSIQIFICKLSLPIQRLANTKAHTSRFVTANLPCNKFKNRLVNIMPYETTRVCLQPIRGLEGSDYINASYIDGYRYVSLPQTLIGPDPLVVLWWLDEWMDWIGFHHSALTCHVMSDLSLPYTCLSRCTAFASVSVKGVDTDELLMIQAFTVVVHTCFDCSSSCLKPDPLLSLMLDRITKRRMKE